MADNYPVDLSLLQGHDDTIHTEYSRVDGSRPFTGEVEGVDPTQPQALATKTYVDTEDAASEVAAESAAAAYTDTEVAGAVSTAAAYTDAEVADDTNHTAYSRVDGTRAYTAEVAGVTPTQTDSLATKGYVDGQIPSSLTDPLESAFLLMGG